jgi:L-lactate dehydrogenase complex protein LldF
MSELYHRFLEDANKKAFDPEYQKRIRFNISKYDDKVVEGKEQYYDLDLARERAAFIKHKVINELEKYLIEFESNFISHGGKVIWASDEKDASKEIIKILKKHEVKTVVKSKSMTTEEIELNEHLKKNKIEAIETDLGEFIVQLADEKPFHIVTPAMHKSKEDVARLFNEKFGTPITDTPQDTTAYVRKLLREKFISAEAGITGANFLIADIGGIALTENEGNGMMTMSFPGIHIVVAGIEKVIPSIKDLDLFWPLLATHGTGQNISVYNSIVTGPRQENESQGPSEMYVILLDNGRTRVLENSEQRRVLSCIRCGACLNVCPVYKTIGGYTYNATYSGPIGSVITPFFNGFKDYKHLSFASTLCGSCTEVCPVKINLHELLLLNRRDAVKKGYTTGKDKIMMWAWKNMMGKRTYLETVKPGMKNFLMKQLVGKAWGERRELPVLSQKSFKQLWEEKKAGK